MNPLLLETILADKRREMLAEADRQRMLAVLSRNRPSRMALLRRILGELVIRLGERIKGRPLGSLTLKDELGRSV